MNYIVNRILTEKEAEILIITSNFAGLYVSDSIWNRYLIDSYPYYAIVDNRITRYKDLEIKEIKIVSYKILLSHLRKKINEQSRDTIKETN